MVPEREKVNECFKEAYAQADKPSSTGDVAQAKAIVSALEGVARSLRDADDTQDSRLAELIGVLNENAVLVADRITEAANAMNTLAQEMRNQREKKGLF